MEALHFGAGNIGRGFIGKLLSDSGVHVTFADINEAIIKKLHEDKRYPVKIVGETQSIEWVENVDGILTQYNECIDLIAKVDLITTAVGPQVLPKIASTIARGLEKRFNDKNQNNLIIIACENMIRATSDLKHHILPCLSNEVQKWVEDHVQFVDSAVDRIVPPSESDSGNILEVTVETFSEWIVDKTQFKGTIPNIKGMECVDNLMAFIERKLFTLNTGHAICAYLGNYFNINTVREAILNPRIREIVKNAMQESGAVLIKRYHFDPATHQKYIDKILTRFENPYLKDENERVGRQPLRKLSHNDRLIKPLLGTIEYQLPNEALLIGIAMALNYNNVNDPQSIEMAEIIKLQGISDAIKTITDLKDMILMDKIVKLYNEVEKHHFK